MIELLPGMYAEASEGHIGWFEERQQKLRELITELWPINLIEIGFHMGHSCKLICDTIVELKQNNDTYKEQEVNFYIFDICYHEFIKENFRILKNHYDTYNIKLNLIKGASQKTVSPFIKDFDAIFDFIEVDGQHTEDATYKDIMDTYTKIREGGVLYIDDYSSTFTSEINKAVVKVDLSGYMVDNIDGILWGIKL